MLALLLFLSVLVDSHPDHPDLPSFPTRRSSDLREGHKMRFERGHAVGKLKSLGAVNRRGTIVTFKPDTKIFGDAHFSPARLHRRSEEHTSELQSPDHLVCRLLLEKKNSASSTCSHSCSSFLYWLTPTPTTQTYPLSLHDALPISAKATRCASSAAMRWAS